MASASAEAVSPELVRAMAPCLPTVTTTVSAASSAASALSTLPAPSAADSLALVWMTLARRRCVSAVSQPGGGEPPRLSVTSAPAAREAASSARGASPSTGAQARREPWPRLHALIEAREALALACLGKGEAFRAATTRAWREIERAAGHDQPAWLNFVRPAEIAVHEAKGLARLGDHAGAALLLRDALEDEQAAPRNRAIYRARLAAALAMHGDREGAMAEAVTVLAELEGPILSPRTLAALQPVRAMAEDAGAGEICARFDAIARRGTHAPDPSWPAGTPAMAV